MADLRKYQQMHATGVTPVDIYRAAQQDGLGEIACIRLIRQLFQLSLVDAKEVMFRATGWSASLQAHQATLIPALEQVLIPALQQSWQVTTRHLEHARMMLPLSAASQPENDAIARYKDWLDHNELELALDELEAIGKQQAGSTAFWQELLAAARNMGLTEHVQRYQAKIDARS
jgi:hypothetical protein